MSSIINGFIIFSLIITVAYFIGLLTFITDHEENKCEMTFMFEYPQFVKISNEIDEQYPKYGLYAYSEGRLTGKTRNMIFDGIPVLFIPGNAGSHRQVRSLASVALRKAYNSRTPFHFDYFSIDLNDELSGLNGALLSDQLSYVNSSIYRVLELYKNSKNAPKSIVLVGHSMGGVIARKLLMTLPKASDLVPIVLTLASPHKRPPLMLDKFLYDFYKEFDYIAYNDTVENTTFISLSGGYTDFLVPSFLTGLQNGQYLQVMTTHIPRSWLVADHLCILWCKQTVLTINRAFFDTVDPKTKQISTDPEFRKSVFHHHLVHHNGINRHLRTDYALKANIYNNGEWVENFGRQYSVHLTNGVKTTHFYMVRLINQPQHEALTVVAINMKTVDWAYVCGAHIPRGNGRVCEEFTHLTHFSEIIPSAKYKRRMLKINMHHLLKNDSELTHVVLRVLPTDEPVVLHVDVHNVEDRKIAVNLPHVLSPKRQILIKETPEKAVHLELVLSQLQHVMQSYLLYVDSTKCSNEMKHATASLIVPWGNHDQHKYFTDSDYKPMHVRLYDSRPQWASNQSAIIRLTLDPSCQYRVSIRSSIPGMLGQMARFYSPLLVTNVGAVILMALNSQLKNMAKEQSCPVFFTAIQEGAKPYYILTSVKLISRVLSVKPFVNFFPTPDWLIMSQEGTDFFLLPLLLYVCSVGIVWFLGFILCGSMIVFETTVHKFALKFLAKTVSFTVSWSDYIMSALHKVPFVVAGALISLTLSTTGSLALCVGTIFYFMRLTQLSQDYIEELVWYYVKKIGAKFKRTKPKKEEKKESEASTSKNEDSKGVEEKNNNKDTDTSVHDTICFHATLFLLWSLITVINVPSVLTWAHNFKYNTTLQPDPSFFPGLILSICALPLWQLELPKIERRWYTQMGQLISVLAVFSLIYAPISIFRLNYILTGAIVLVVLHQILGPNRDLTVTQSERPSWFDTIKAKLE